MTYELHEMDCRLAMSMLMDADSIDAIVTDPPYGLSKEPDVEEVLRHWLNGDDYAHGSNGFMGRSWDSFVPGPAIWREAYRVLKPGGHLVAFFGTRTYDLGVMALRMAGFEIRDQLAWVFGSGFPKSHDVSKGIDKRGGANIAWFGPWLRAERERRGIGQRELCEMTGFHGAVNRGGAVANWELGLNLPTAEQFNILCRVLDLPFAGIAEAEREVISQTKGTRLAVAPGQENDRSATTLDTTAAGSKEAAQWQGWGTALKPAYEPIVLCRKPLSEPTVAANVLRWGVGAINIDGCRIGDEVRHAAYTSFSPCHGNSLGKPGTAEARRGTQGEPKQYVGRWPANLCHDGSPEVLAEFPVTSSGKMKAGTVRAAQDEPGSVCYGTFGGRATDTDTPGDSGSAARFYYCAKASKSDRNEGLDDLPEQPSAASQFRPNHAEGAANGEDGNPYGRWSPVRNIHPTVKPTDLMRWLVRLITPPGGTVLDPFAGSGSTGKAAILEGFSFVGCEMTPEYVAIARRRIDHAVNSR